MNRAGLGARHRMAVDLGLAGAALFAVLSLLLPLPTPIVDLLLAAQFLAVVVTLGAALFAHRARRSVGRTLLDAFPALIVVTTFLRLALAVAATRLILARGDAGMIIDALGRASVAESALAGLAVFALIALMQLVVVARGAARVAEVAARFSLDAMPGEQLAIDAEVRAGLIDARAAAERRALLRRESRFFAAMDGAMRFVRGDAVLTLIAVGVALFGGLLVGVLGHGMSPAGAASRYAALAVGCGLATAVPALFAALAAGLFMTRPVSAER